MRFFGLFLFAVSLFVSLTIPSGVRAELNKAGEYQVKGAFILNFANFVQWPDTVSARGSFTIGILGEDSFGSALNPLQGKTVKGKKIVIKWYDEPEDALEADILFICASEQQSLPQILKILRGRPVLTIGDSPGFGRSGVMINMLVLRKRVVFEINRAAANREGLQISSQLLKLAQEVIN